MSEPWRVLTVLGIASVAAMSGLTTAHAAAPTAALDRKPIVVFRPSAQSLDAYISVKGSS